MNDFLFSADAEAERLRREFIWGIYPLVNACGRMAGAVRGSYRQGTGGADDMNRHYVRTSVGLEIVDFNIAATDALQAQYDRPISVYLDSHGSFGFGGATERQIGRAHV